MKKNGDYKFAKKSDVMNKHYEKALRLAKKKNPDNKRVFDLLNKAIKEDCGEASYALATWYLFGEYVEKDLSKAVMLLQKAAKHNIANACFDLALSYETGQGIDQDFTKAFQFYLRGALYGDCDCFAQVGRCYQQGIGIHKSHSIAEIWFEKAEFLGVELEYDNIIELNPKKRMNKNYAKATRIAQNKNPDNKKVYELPCKAID